MKYILLVCLIVLGFGTAQAQNELQFNQVVLITFLAPTSPYTSPDYTVPAGKVWKIESAGSSSNINVYEINGVRISGQINTSGSFNGGQNLPLWLPAGTVIKFYNGGSTSTGCYVSILEFNVFTP